MEDEEEEENKNSSEFSALYAAYVSTPYAKIGNMEWGPVLGR